MSKYTAKIEKIGDDLCVVLPPELWAEMRAEGWRDGDYRCKPVNGELFIFKEENIETKTHQPE